MERFGDKGHITQFQHLFEGFLYMNFDAYFSCSCLDIAENRLNYYWSRRVILSNRGKDFGELNRVQTSDVLAYYRNTAPNVVLVNRFVYAPSRKPNGQDSD